MKEFSNEQLEVISNFERLGWLTGRTDPETDSRFIQLGRSTSSAGLPEITVSGWNGKPVPTAKKAKVRYEDGFEELADLAFSKAGTATFAPGPVGGSQLIEVVTLVDAKGVPVAMSAEALPE